MRTSGAASPARFLAVLCAMALLPGACALRDRPVEPVQPVSVHRAAPLSPGQQGVFVLYLETGADIGTWRPYRIDMACPHTNLLDCDRLFVGGTGTPLRLPFTVSPDARPGAYQVRVPLWILLCSPVTHSCRLLSPSVTVVILIEEASGNPAGEIPIRHRITGKRPSG